MNNGNLLNKILIQAQIENASDIHLSSGLKPYCRVQGDMKVIGNFDVLTAQQIFDFILPILDKYNQELLIKNQQTDFAYYNVDNKTRYRGNLYKTTQGMSAVFRQLNSTIPILEEAGYPEIFQKIASLDKGLILVCGPTGSGKSTTLASMINFINRKFKKHILTIEDPVEYVFKTDFSLIDQREVGKHVNSFADGLKGALREDPDIIMIGEMRDRETIKMALTAAETGHLVFSTLHTMSASKTIDRIIDSCEAGEKDVIRNMISTSLQAIVLQTLLKNSTNTKRVPAYEILIGTNSVRNLIREGKVYQIDSIIQTGSKFGMITMEESIKNLVDKGIVSKEEVDLKFNKLDNVN